MNRRSVLRGAISGAALAAVASLSEAAIRVLAGPSLPAPVVESHPSHYWAKVTGLDQWGNTVVETIRIPWGTPFRAAIPSDPGFSSVKEVHLWS